MQIATHIETGIKKLSFKRSAGAIASDAAEVKAATNACDMAGS